MPKTKLTPEQEKRKCGGCYWLYLRTMECVYPDKLEFGKYGKCLKKRKG